jgi:hypothetical protein
MRDELHDRDYQAGRAALHDGLASLFRNLAGGLAALHRKQWAAPWKSAPRGDCTGLA